MSLSDLTKGAIPRLTTDDDTLQNPVCQVLTLKRIPNSNEGAPDRFRVILSDGEYYNQAMLSTQSRELVDSGELVRFSLVRIISHSASTVQGRRILILLSIEVVGQADDKIGSPAVWDKAGMGEGAATGPPVKSENAGNARQAYDQNGSGGGGVGAGAARAIPRQGTTMAPVNNLPIYPIEALSPYQNKWTIKARVTSKSEIKHWSNAKGEGKLFSCNFLDESAEIKATAFNDQVDRWYNVLKEGSVYYISKAKVTIARKQFSNLPNEYEISFERDTTVQECEDTSDVPDIKFDFKPLDQLDGVEPKQTCDIISVVDEVGELTSITTKSQKPFAKRELTLVDQTGMSVKLTLWGKTAETYGTPSGQVGCAEDDKPVIAFKGVSVSEFGGRSLSMFSSASMAVNPDIPEAHSLRGWYDTEGMAMAQNKSFRNYAGAGLGGTGAGAGGDFVGNIKERRTIAEAKNENLGMAGGDKPDYFNMRAMVVHIRHENLYYPACPTDGCNKKVNLEEGSNSWRCEKCNMSFEAPEYRYIISANVQDHTGQMWLSGFNDVGVQMLGITANEYNAAKESGEDAEMSLTLLKAAGKLYMFNIRAKQETYNDSPRVRYTITKMVPVDYVKAGEELADAIKKYL